MNKKNGFTLVEILICLILIGVLSAAMIANMKVKRFDDQTMLANIFKAVDAIDGATTKIIELETEKCPTGSLITNVTGTPTFTFVNNSGTNMTTNEVVDLYGNYLKYEETGFNFCDKTSYCTKASITDTDKIKGAKLPGDIYIGFEVTDIIDCPNYYLPNSSTETTGRGKCWGKTYIDINGSEAPNELGKDVFIYGLNGKGIAK